MGTYEEDAKKQEENAKKQEKVKKYEENAKKYEADIEELKAKIRTYKAKHQKDNPIAVSNTIIALKRELVFTEIKLSNDYNAIYREGKKGTFEKLSDLQVDMQKDITSLQDDLMLARKKYIENHNVKMQKEFPLPPPKSKMGETVKEMANYNYILFQSIRELLTLQKKKISYCKNMNQYELSNAKKFRADLREKYGKSFDELFTLTETGMRYIGIEEKKRLLEVRKNLIEQGQKDFSDEGGRIIVKKPQTLQNICDKANRVNRYTRQLDEDIKEYRLIIDNDKEMRRAEEEYYKSGRYAQDQERERQEQERRQQEEDARYNLDNVIPDEGYRDEEGNIINLDDDDERDI